MKKHISELFTTFRAAAAGHHAGGAEQISGSRRCFPFAGDFSAAEPRPVTHFSSPCCQPHQSDVYPLCPVAGDRAGARPYPAVRAAICLVCIGGLFITSTAAAGSLDFVMSFVAGHAFAMRGLLVIISEIYPTKVRGRACPSLRPRSGCGYLGTNCFRSCRSIWDRMALSGFSAGALLTVIWSAG